MPHTAIDPIYIGSQIVSALQSIVSRNIDPFEPAVVTIGVFSGGTRYNVIPETAKIQGTVRTFDEGVRMKVREMVSSGVNRVKGSNARPPACPVVSDRRTNKEVNP